MPASTIPLLGSLRLLGAEEEEDQEQGNTSVNSVSGERVSQPILTGLESVRRFSLTGRVTAPRLAEDPNWSVDPLIALAEWAVEFESYLHAGQGDGYTFTTSEGDTYNVVVEQLGHQREEGKRFELAWDLELLATAGASRSESRRVETFNLADSATIEGRDLEHVRAHRVQRQQSFEVYKLGPDTPAAKNEATSKSGPTRKFLLRGQATNDPEGLKSDLADWVGSDTQVTYKEAFPGREIEGMIDDYQAFWKSREPGILDYNLTLIEGEAV